MKTGWMYTNEQGVEERFAPKTIVSQVLLSENGTDIMTALNQMILNRCYPVGAIYLSTSDVAPGSIIGGNWERIENKVLVARGETPGVQGNLAYSSSGTLECELVYAWRRIL